MIFKESVSLSEIPLLQDQIVVGVNNEHPWAKRSHVTIRDFENVSFNTFDPSFSVHTQLLDLFKINKVSPNIDFCGSSSEFLCEITALSNGIVILPRPIIKSICQDQMALIPFKLTIGWELSLAFRKNSYISMAAKVLIKHLQEYF